MLRIWTSAAGRISGYRLGHARSAYRSDQLLYKNFPTCTIVHRLYSSSNHDVLHDKSVSKPGSHDHEATKSASKRKQASRRPHSFRRAVIDASSPRRSGRSSGYPSHESENEKLATAYCVATSYNFSDVQYLLRNRGFRIDPCGTTLSQQVIHIEMPTSTDLDPLRPTPNDPTALETGDVFIFPSGTVVSWAVPQASILRLVQEVLWAAAEGHHVVEDEDFEYVEDAARERSAIQGETIVLGTRSHRDSDGEDDKGRVAVVLAKIAFSAGLARSTKLAVLEGRLEAYLEGTKTIPEKLMSGQLGSFSRAFIYLKMGQLLDLRRQLNLSSDITDSLPDVFWDAEADLGLEGYYNGMSAALDTRQRIVSLNEKIGYAHEIASILREELSVIREQQNERHSTRLEWIIILLITVEVLFGSWDLYQKWLEKKAREDGNGEGGNLSEANS